MMRRVLDGGQLLTTLLLFRCLPALVRRNNLA
jgi:hypothetical protein